MHAHRTFRLKLQNTRFIQFAAELPQSPSGSFCLIGSEIDLDGGIRKNDTANVSPIEYSPSRMRCNGSSERLVDPSPYLWQG